MRLISFTEQFANWKFVIEESNSLFYLFIEAPNKSDSRDYVYDTLEGAKYHAEHNYKVDSDSWKEVKKKTVAEKTFSEVPQKLIEHNIIKEEDVYSQLPITIRVITYEDTHEFTVYLILGDGKELDLMSNNSLEQLVHDLKKTYNIAV